MNERFHAYDFHSTILLRLCVLRGAFYSFPLTIMRNLPMFFHRISLDFGCDLIFFFHSILVVFHVDCWDIRMYRKDMKRLARTSELSISQIIMRYENKYLKQFLTDRSICMYENDFIYDINVHNIASALWWPPKIAISFWIDVHLLLGVVLPTEECPMTWNILLAFVRLDVQRM